MKPVMMAALVVQMTTAGGAGTGAVHMGERPSIGRDFSALKKEISSLKQQFREARERARREAEQKQREEEGEYEPQAQPGSSSALTAPGGSAAR